MTGDRAPAELASELRSSRDQLVAFVLGCSTDQWTSSEVVPGDSRPVGVIADHVADAYGYLGGWVCELVAGGNPAVSAEIVDALNDRHASAAAGVSREEAAAHLRTGGDDIAGVIDALSPGDLAIGDGRVERLIRIAIRHTHDHLTQLAAAVGAGRSD